VTPDDESEEYPEQLQQALLAFGVALEGVNTSFPMNGLTVRGIQGSGALDGQRIAVCAGRTYGRGDYSSFVMSAALRLNLGLHCEPKGFARSHKHISVEHDAFNQEYDVQGDEPDQVRALLSQAICAEIVALGSLGGEVHLRDTQIEVHQSWGFLEVEPPLRGLARVASLIEAQSLQLPPPAQLTDAVEVWCQYAADNGFAFSRSPLRISGEGVAAQAMHTAPTRYETQISVALPEPLAAGLSLRTAGRLELIVEMLAGPDVQFSDGPFDRAFTVNAEKEDVVRLAFDAEVRVGLLALRECGVVGFTDHGVTLHTTRHAEVPASVEAMRAIVRRVHGNLKAAAGPYR